MEEQTEENYEPNLVSRLGINQGYKIGFDNNGMIHIMQIDNFKGKKAQCFYCYNELNNDDCYFCRTDRIFMCKDCVTHCEKKGDTCTFRHKVSFIGTTEHQDVKVAIVNDDN